MKILFYGGNGWIGSKFVKYIKETVSDVFVYVGKSRVDDIDKLEREIAEIKPTHVISFIGRTSGGNINNIDYLEQEGKLVENIRDNLFSPIILAVLSRNYGYHLTYMGTGCIFTYDSEHTIENLVGFKEDDVPNFTGSSYSIVKGFTDKFMQLEHFPTLNIRIRMPISYEKHRKNFITKITNYKKICNMPNSMTVLEDFFPIFLDMIQKNRMGTYNCTNPGLIDHNQILTLYKKYVDPTFHWENFSIEEQNNILLSKRSNNYLDTSKIQKEYPQLPHIKESIINVMKNYK